ncbi:basement membrane-specific heparan sulfate proteoglycan core protein-like [Paramisgurnus dabryanus]|uniref:basement membrane-specific heparan sulfate proteoglycan core protein-like n=1 Tax=Paramisgurnus dabryanus TaxID=90735 RepID=UPI0031F45B98
MGNFGPGGPVFCQKVSSIPTLPRATVRVTPDRSVFTGETVTLKCEIEDQDRSLNWTYRWDNRRTSVFNSERYTVDGDSLTINGVTESDQNNYWCVVERDGRPQKSLYVDLTVKALPRVTVIVTPDRFVFTGETVTLKCEIEDQYRNWRYLWNNSRTEMLNSGRYTVNRDSVIINRFTESDQNEYWCSAEIDGRPQTLVSSSPVNLTVKALPRVTVRVTPDRSVFTGETVDLTCEIEDQYSDWRYQYSDWRYQYSDWRYQNSDWRYLWYKGGTGSSVFEGKIYTIRSPSDQDEFWCRGEKYGRPSSSQDSDHVTLSVKALPRVTVIVTPDRSVFIGETVTLKCEIEDQYRSLNWKYWWANRHTSERYTVNRDSLTITRFTQSDQDEYWCSAEIHGRPQSSRRSSSVDLTVKALPRATVRVTPDRSVFTGETVTLKCEIEDQYSNWRYLWYKDRTGTAVFKENIYTIRSPSDQDKFRCRGERDGRPSSSQYSDHVTLSVKALPSITVRVTPDRSVFTGETVTLKCEIEDQYRSLNWTYLWYKRGNEVFNSGRFTVNRGSLTINTITQSDQDKYWCSAEIHGRPQTKSSSAVNLTVNGSKPKPKLTSSEGSVLTGNTVTLKCHIDHWSTGGKFYWYKNTQNTEKTTTETNSYTINRVKVSDGGQYWCRAGRGQPDYYTDYSDGLWINVKDSPKPVVSVDPDKQLFRGETVTLRCDIQDTGDTEWTYSWTAETYNLYRRFYCDTQECKINNIQQTDSGKYTCRGKIREHNTEMSDAVTLTVSSDKPQTVLSVSPDRWLTEGESVTLICEVRSSSTGWTFSWFTVQSHYSVDYQLVSNSSGGSKGIYTVSSVTVKHTGVYMCRAERGDPVYHTEYSNTQTLWITGVSPSVSLIIRPNRSQHFSSESLSLSCEDHSISTGWTVRRYTDELKPCSSSDWRSTETTSTCTIRSLHTSDTGVYWCQSESGEKLHPVNISVHNADVILDSPVHPVTERDPLTLRCLYRDKNPSNLRAEFYKDGSVVQSRTTGDMMIIPTVSKSHEGFYYCKHPERGESPKSWISVRATRSSSLGLNLGFVLSFMFLIFFLVLLWCYKNKKLSQCLSAVSQQQNISQTSDQKQTEDVYTPLPTDNVNESADHIYADIELKPKKEMKKKMKHKKDNVSEAADHIYANIELKPQKEMKKDKKGNTSEGGKNVYSKLKKGGGQGVAFGSVDVAYS